MVRNAQCQRPQAYSLPLVPGRPTSRRTTVGMSAGQRRAQAEPSFTASATRWRTRPNTRLEEHLNWWASFASRTRQQRRSGSFTKAAEPSWAHTWTTCGTLIQLSGGTQTSNCAMAQRWTSVQPHKHSLMHYAGYEEGQLPGPHTSGGRGAVGNGCFGTCSLLRVRERRCLTPPIWIPPRQETDR